MTPEQERIYNVDIGQDLPMPGLRIAPQAPSNVVKEQPQWQSRAEPFGADWRLRGEFESIVSLEPDARFRLDLGRHATDGTKYRFERTQQAFEFFKAGFNHKRESANASDRVPVNVNAG